MGILSFFRRSKSSSAPDASLGSSWADMDIPASFREPLSPPAFPTFAPPSLSTERPQSFMQSDMQLLLAKLDVLATKLDQVSLRLERLEQALHLTQQPSPPPSSFKPIRSW